MKEFNKYDNDPNKWIKLYKSINSITKKPFDVDVGYERFMAPEIFFHPEVSSLTTITSASASLCTAFFPQLIIVFPSAQLRLVII